MEKQRAIPALLKPCSIWTEMTAQNLMVEYMHDVLEQGLTNHDAYYTTVLSRLSPRDGMLRYSTLGLLKDRQEYPAHRLTSNSDLVSSGVDLDSTPESKLSVIAHDLTCPLGDKHSTSKHHYDQYVG